MEKKNKKVSVVMPVFNSELFLTEAIESVLVQSFRDFELVIVNDGSTDSTQKILNGFEDKRITIINNEINLGLIYSLNRGISESNSEYIIRMDSDDISVSDRFEILVKYMDENPEVGACSSFFEFGINSNRVIKYPLSHEEIYLNFLNSCPFGHAPAILRRTVLVENNLNYDSDFIHSEDSNLWIRMLNVTCFANIPDMLYQVRLHPNSVTQKYPEQVNSSFQKSRNIHFANICTRLNEPVTILPFSNRDNYYNHIIKLEDKILKLINKNRLTKLFNEALFNKNIARLWLEIVNNPKNVSFISLIHIIKSPLIAYSHMVGLYRLILFKKWLKKHLSII